MPRVVDETRLRVVFGVLVLVASEVLKQHAVTREVTFVGQGRLPVRLSWWCARYATWRLRRHVSRNERYYALECGADLLGELTQTLRGLREMGPPGKRQYVVLCPGSRPDPFLAELAEHLATSSGAAV
ncbi:MAG: hypothetical protein QOD83_3615 [Solirubrobacteraceae bacterium]|jgi:hypothetical protein|nr:hypothetical protein [Solirubrobacteraceae bacterium]